MQQNFFNLKTSIIACTFAILTPIITSLALVIIGSIIAPLFQMEAKTLLENNIFSIIATVLTELSFLLVVYLICKRNKISLLSSIGIKSNSSSKSYIICAIFSILSLFLLTPIINCWQELLINLGYQVNTSLPLNPDSIPNLLLCILIFALIPAICEETLFRGVLQNGLHKYGFISIIISATFFSLMHQNVQQLPYTFLLGIILGLSYYYTKNLKLSILLHFLNNAIVLIIGFFTQNTITQITLTYIIISIVCIVLFVLLLFLMLKLFKTNKIQTSPLPQKELEFKKPEFYQFMLPLLIGIVSLLLYTLSGFGVI